MMAPRPEPKKFEKLLLDEGDFLVFNRGFIHCGSSCEKENRRIRAYLLLAEDVEGADLRTTMEGEIVVSKRSRLPTDLQKSPTMGPHQDELGGGDDVEVLR